MLIDNCRVVRRTSKKKIKLCVDSLPEDPRLSPYFHGNEFSLRVQQGTVESSILNCASIAEASVNIEASHGLLLKNEKHVLQLAKIHNHASILKAAQYRLNELYQYQGTNYRSQPCDAPETSDKERQLRFSLPA